MLGRSWPLLAAPGRSWPLLAPPGRSWPLLAAPLLAAPGVIWLHFALAPPGPSPPSFSSSSSSSSSFSVLVNIASPHSSLSMPSSCLFLLSSVSSLTICYPHLFLASSLLFVILFLPSFPLHVESFGHAFNQSRGACSTYVPYVFFHTGSRSLSCQHPFKRSPFIL